MLFTKYEASSLSLCTEPEILSSFQNRAASSCGAVSDVGRALDRKLPPSSQMAALLQVVQWFAPAQLLLVGERLGFLCSEPPKQTDPLDSTTFCFNNSSLFGTSSLLQSCRKKYSPSWSSDGIFYLISVLLSFIIEIIILAFWGAFILAHPIACKEYE